MSFKRDESDPGPLGALQRRRVAELLASAIPEDEALLLRDGRLACSLCPQRPVCDTLQTLLLHRAGRKHLDALQRSFGRRRCPQVAPQGPQVTLGVAPAVQAPLLARTRRLARSALLRAAPYSSCCRRATTKGSSSRAGIPGMIPKNSQMLPEPSRNPGIPGNPETAGPTHTEGVPKDRKRGRKGNSRSSEGPEGNSRSSEGPSPERLRILRHHLHLRSRGWLQDPAGNWVKDGNAEFDSDEEEPPPLPPA
ncbi:sodium channel modifier 1 isoform X1 [Onychostruthus taczanowskii]|uniref:sodium channel modifier 1 isoform X1 n=1 Tax=Onychostruthus taczanowskii TaxID=356909 RepID=UPI001B80CCB9|nr:sodium channel modifier 1 isoform X1 [Onychostruthus taczanowskii]